MSISLARLKFVPEERWFEYDTNGKRIEEGAKTKMAFALRLRFLEKDEVTAILTAAAERLTISKGGAKAVQTNQQQAKLEVANAGLMDWKMSPNGLYALQTKIDFEKLGKEPVPFTPENLAFMIESSLLSNVIFADCQDHAVWYKRPPEEVEAEAVKNSVTGPSSSSAEPHVDPASKGT